MPHPELEDASQNVTWVVWGIADRSGRVVQLAEPVNRPCMPSINRWQHEGNIPTARGGRVTFEQWMEYGRQPIPEAFMKRGYDPTTGLWTTVDGWQVAVPSELLADGYISIHESDWIDWVAVQAENAAAESGGGPVAVAEPSYEDWKQWETARIEEARVDYRPSDLPIRHHDATHSRSVWETIRQGAAEYGAVAFSEMIYGAELDTPARYGEWVTGKAVNYPEEFMRSTYRIVEQHRQPGSMHWLYNDGTAVDVDGWALPASEWDRWAARHRAGTLHTGVLITPMFVRHWETDRSVVAGNIGVHHPSDWSWANVEMQAGSDADDADDDTPVWTIYLTSCMEPGFPAVFSRQRWGDWGLFAGFAPDASDVPVWAWPGVLSRGRWAPADHERADWPRWTWENHPDIRLPGALRASKLPPADCAGIAAGRYTPDYTYPVVGAGNYPDWMAAVGLRPPDTWFRTDSPFDE